MVSGPRFVRFGDRHRWPPAGLCIRRYRRQRRLPRIRRLHAVFEAGDATHLGAVGAAINRVVRFDAVADYAAVAVGAARREQMNGAFEAVERMTFAFGDDFE